MIVVYDPVGVVARYDLELRRFQSEYHEDWAAFTDRAPASVAAIVVLHDELNGELPGGPLADRRSEAISRLRALVRTLGPIPVIVVRGPGLDYTRLRRAGVECVLPHTKLDRLPELLDDLLLKARGSGSRTRWRMPMISACPRSSGWRSRAPSALFGRLEHATDSRTSCTRRTIRSGTSWSIRQPVRQA